MSYNLFVNGLLIGIAASIPLGPIGVFCVQRTVNKNQKSGFYAGLGAATSDCVYAIIAGFSLTYIIDFLKLYELFFQISGAAILFFLGLHIFRSNPAADVRKFKKKGEGYLQDYLITLAITFSNPLAIFVFLAIFAGSGIVLNLGQPLNAITIIGGIFLGAASWWFSLTSVVNFFRHKITLRKLWWGNKIAGAAIMGFSLFTILYFQFFS